MRIIGGISQGNIKETYVLLRIIYIMLNINCIGFTGAVE